MSRIIELPLPPLFLFLSLFISCGDAFAQQTQQQKKLAYSSFMQQYHSKPAAQMMMVTRRDTFVHPYAVVTAHFVKEKVYPDRDALELYQALNPGIKMDNPNTRINTTAKFVTPRFTPPTAAVLMRFNQEYIIASAPDPATNAAFENTRLQFKSMIYIMARIENPPFSKGIWDSLNMLNDYAFPAFSKHAGQISKTQMGYINNEVSTLIRLFGNLNKKSKLIQAPSVESVEARKSFIVKDLFDLSNLPSWGNLLPTKQIRYSGGVAAYKTSGYNLKWNMPAGSLADRPFKCNVYVFESAPTSGVPAPEPIPGRYYVWLGDKASFDNLIPGCDSTSMGFPRNGNLASTLPVAIGFGTYIIILKDRFNGAVLTKEVSISTETEFEQKDETIRKIIFLTN